jgi:molecular chaperone GrpE
VARASESEDLEQLRARASERDHFLDLLRRTRAEFENYQKRARRTQEEERRYQYGRLVLNLLPVLDDLERALAAARQAGDSGPLAQGVALVRNMFLDVLRRYGVTPVEVLGQPFDPNLHHAVMTRVAAGQPVNSILEVVKQGYRIQDRLLRPAEVVVAMPVAPGS